jgi:2-phospho-L-lactate/phosphoenolpyruvate guanylyltransferase
VIVLVLIPCKNLDQGKSRLKNLLDDRSRRALCEFFLYRTLALATSVTQVNRVKVVTADPRVVSIGRDYGVSAILDCGTDLNSALAGARAALVREAFEERNILVLPIDLPYASQASMTKVMSTRADMVIAPDWAGKGTNLLLLECQAFRNFDFAYGENSCKAHCDIANNAGLMVRIIKDEQLAFDVDHPDQYLHWLKSTGHALVRRQQFSI